MFLVTISIHNPTTHPFFCSTFPYRYYEISVTDYTRHGKGKGHPITGHEGPEMEQRYSSTLYLTSALDGR